MALPALRRARQLGMDIAIRLGLRQSVAPEGKSGSDYIRDQTASRWPGIRGKTSRGGIVRAREVKDQLRQQPVDPRYLMRLPKNEPYVFAAMNVTATQVTKRGGELKPLYVVRCALCGTRYDHEVDKCETPGCLGAEDPRQLIKPDPRQLRRVKQFIDHPNPTRQWSDFLHDAIYGQVGCALTTWEIVRARPLDPKSPVVEIEPLPPERMRVQLGPNGLPGDPDQPFCLKCVRSDPKQAAHPYPKDLKLCSKCGTELVPTAWTMLAEEVGNDEVRMRYAAHEIAWYKFAEFSPLLPLVDTVQLIVAMRTWQTATFQQGAPADRIVVMRGADQDQVDDMHDDVIAARDQNPRGNVEVWLAAEKDSATDVVSLMPAPREMLLVQVYDRLMNEIAAATGVSKEAFGIQTGGQLGQPKEVLTISLDTAETHALQAEEFLKTQILPLFDVTDFYYALNRPDLTDEQAEETLKDKRVDRMLKLRSAGFNVKLKDTETFEFETDAEPNPIPPTAPTAIVPAGPEGPPRPKPAMPSVIGP